MFNQKIIVMKKLVFVSTVLAWSLTSNLGVSAKAQNEIDALCRSSSQDEKTKIKKEELPEPVRTKLKGDAYKGWSVVNAYKLRSGAYEVELKKGDTTQVLTFDKDGNAK
jgi:predicted metal-binding membrane protein